MRWCWPCPTSSRYPAQAEGRGVAARVLLHLRLVRLAMVDDHSVMAAYITPSEPTKERPVHAH